MSDHKNSANRTRVVGTFVLLDLDRTLIRTIYIHDIFVDLVQKRYQLKPGLITRACKATEATGGSFDTAGYIRQILQSDANYSDVESEMNALKKDFVAEVSGDENMFEPGALNFLKRLHRTQTPHGIITYGSQWWQETKIAAAKLENALYLIVPDARKGMLVASWVNKNGHYELPEEFSEIGVRISAKTICLVDDKATSFQWLPEISATGYWYAGRNESDLLPSQSGEVASNVTKIYSLNEINVNNFLE